jgi:hypothetical protein
MKTYVFHDKHGAFSRTYRDDLTARRDAERFPGTLKVEDTNGRVVWRYPGRISNPRDIGSHFNPKKEKADA